MAAQLCMLSSRRVAKRKREMDRTREREYQRISTRIDLEVLNSFDLIITPSTRDSEGARVYDKREGK